MGDNGNEEVEEEETQEEGNVKGRRLQLKAKFESS